jgi:uncharacterized protein YbaP (TraB family)
MFPRYDEELVNSASDAMQRGLGIVGLMLLLWCSGGGARAEVAHHSLWRVTGKHNVVYLLGSVHMLKTEDSVLPEVAINAYHDAALLMMELDPTEMTAVDRQRSTWRLRMLPRGQSLARVLGPELYAQYQEQALPLGINADLLSRYQPWYVAMMMGQTQLARAGYDNEAGIDSQFGRMARSDGKPIIELETMREQLGFFARLSNLEQREYLHASLKETETLESDVADLVEAWKHGDTLAMEDAMREQREESPVLFRRLTIERNRRWLPRIVALLNRRQNALVVVGAMHLVSADGLIELLEARGYEVQQQ